MNTSKKIEAISISKATGHAESTVVSHPTMEAAVQHVRDFTAAMSTEGRETEWQIIGIREIDGKTITFWAAQSRPLTAEQKAQAQLKRDLLVEFDGWDVEIDTKKHGMTVITIGMSVLRIRYSEVQDAWYVITSSGFKSSATPSSYISKQAISQWMDKACCL